MAVGLDEGSAAEEEDAMSSFFCFFFSFPQSLRRQRGHVSEEV